MKITTYISLLFCWCFATAPLHELAAQEYDFFCLGQADGLPVDGVYDLIEDQHGALLIATEGAGLARFDGEKVRFWDHNSGLGADTVRTMALASDGGIWIGTDGHGLFYMKDEVFSAVAPDELAHSEIRCLSEDQDGTLWIGTFDRGLFQLTENQLVKIDLKAETIRSLLLHSDGSMFVGTDEGLFVQKEDQFERIDLKAHGGNSNKVLTLFEDSKHQLWIGTLKGALIWSNQEIQLLPKEVQTARIKAIAEDQQGHIWLGSRTGAYELESASGKTIKYTSESGLSNDRIRKIYKDRSGSLWFGTYFGGACQLKDQLTSRYTREQGFPETPITNLAIAPDSALWFTTYENDVYRLGASGLKRIIQSNGNELNSVLSSDEHAILFRTGEKTISKVDHSDTLFQPSFFCWTRLEISEVLQAHPKAYFLAEDALSSLEKLLNNTDFACERITTVVKDQDQLLVGTSCGIYAISLDENGAFIVPSNLMSFLPISGSENLKISCLKLDESNNLWVGTERDGLYKFNGKMKHYSSRYLTDARITAIELDDQQNLWVATRGGLTFLELDPSQEMVLNHQFYGVEQGVDAQINDMAWSNEGQLWLATSKGLEQLNPDGDFQNTVPPFLEITGLRLNYDPVDWTEMNFEASNGLPLNLALDHNENHLTFDFKGIDLSQPDALIYQCYLEGFDLDWIDVTNLTAQTYPQLPPGDFNFKVRSRNSSGLWNTEPPSYEFTIQKPLYQEPWFIAFLLIGLSAVVYFFFQYRLSRLKKTKVILEQKVHQRTKELHKEKEISERLLLNILPKETADELKEKGYADTRNYESASVLFSDFKGFTNLTEQMNSDELVKMLDSAFKAFDRNCDRFGVEKIKTIGDAYMCAAGIPKEDTSHALNLVAFAQAMLVAMEELNLHNTANGLPTWDIRIGIHSGPLIAGVVGEKKFAYDIWGDTVNLASRMESSGEPGRINLSESTYALIRHNYKCSPRGKIKAKNKGELEMYFLEQD
jgi:ligand-binding sensor domain-containing protein/class 3 adenylate cyclase